MTILRPAPIGTNLVVCTTCRQSSENPVNDAGQRGGEQLRHYLQKAIDEDPRFGGISIAPMACLFACSQHCTVHLRAAGKIGYVLGSFTPTPQAASAILEYALQHDESAEGIVPYRNWPEGVKGHFIVRTPPEGFVAAD